MTGVAGRRTPRATWPEKPRKLRSGRWTSWTGKRRGPSPASAAGEGDGFEVFEEGGAGVPGHVGAGGDDVVAFEGADGDHADGFEVEAGGEGEELLQDGVKGLFGVADEVHLVDGGDDVGDAEERGDGGVAAGLGEEGAEFEEGAGVEEDDGDVGGGGPGGHVAGVLLVAGGVGDDELAAGGGEVAVGDVDGDSLLALGFEAVGEEGEVDVAAGGAVDAGAGDGG